MEPEDPPTGPGPGPRSRSQRKERVAATAIRLADLDPVARRRALFRCAATIVLSWTFVIGAFYVLPIGHESGLRAIVRLGVDIALVGVVFAWQIRRISMAELPELRAVEALGIVVVVFLTLFSGIYLAMSHESAATFTNSLDHTRALYLTITIFSTVGFGDITPRTDTARLVVSIQMLLDFVIIGAAVRMIFSAARSRVAPAVDVASATDP
jgi:voltage-gated potassium channel